MNILANEEKFENVRQPLVLELTFDTRTELGIFEYRNIRIRNRIPFLKKIFYIRIPITPCKIVFDYRLQYFFLHIRIK
jgi:hypothetical protein